MALRVTIPLAEGEAFVDLDGDRLVVGRGRGADLRIPDVSVSGRHLLIEKRRAGYVLLAQAGANACVLADGTQLSEGAEHALLAPIWLAVGRVWMHFAPTPEAAPPHAKATRALTELLMRHTLLARGIDTTTRMIVVAGKNTGDELLLAGASTSWSIGRSEECDLVLRDVSVSRIHATIFAGDQELHVVNEGGKQGSWLQGRALAPGEHAELKHGAVLRLANVELLCVEPVSRALEDLDAAADLRVDAKHLPPSPTRSAVSSVRAAESSITPLNVQHAYNEDAVAPAHRRAWRVEDVVISAVGIAMAAASVLALRAIFAR